MILSVSRRTDIACCYSKWLLKRLRDGFVLVRNPLNPKQVSRVPLGPDVVDAIVFWTKDPGPILPRLNAIEALGYRYGFQFTLNAYGRDLEPGLRDLRDRIADFQALGRRLGKERMLWRYDPILLTGKYTPAWHREQFARLAEKVSPFARHVTISFVDLYAHLRGAPFQAPSEAQARDIAASISEIAHEYDLPVYSCAEARDYTELGIRRGACLEPSVLEDIAGVPLRLAKAHGQRPACGCVESVDIGAYDTCGNGCVYCYACHSRAAVARSVGAHDPNSALLTGTLSPDDRVLERRVRSNAEGQLRMEL